MENIMENIINFQKKYVYKLQNNIKSLHKNKSPHNNKTYNKFIQDMGINLQFNEKEFNELYDSVSNIHGSDIRQIYNEIQSLLKLYNKVSINKHKNVMEGIISGINNIIEKNIDHSIIESFYRTINKGKQVGGAPIKESGDTICVGNNTDDDGCYLDPISLECLDHDDFILTPHDECFQLDGLCRYLREHGVNTSPLSRREYSDEWIRTNCGDIEDDFYDEINRTFTYTLMFFMLCMSPMGANVLPYMVIICILALLNTIRYIYNNDWENWSRRDSGFISTVLLTTVCADYAGLIEGGYSKNTKRKVRKNNKRKNTKRKYTKRKNTKRKYTKRKYTKRKVHKN